MPTPDQPEPQQPSVALLDRPWVRTLILTTISGAVSLAVTSATLVLRGRDYLDSRDEKLIQQIRSQDHPHYLTRVDYLAAEVVRAEKVNAKLEKILEKLD